MDPIPNFKELQPAMPNFRANERQIGTPPDGRNSHNGKDHSSTTTAASESTASPSPVVPIASSDPQHLSQSGVGGDGNPFAQSTSTPLPSSVADVATTSTQEATTSTGFSLATGTAGADVTSTPSLVAVATSQESSAGLTATQKSAIIGSIVGLAGLLAIGGIIFFFCRRRRRRNAARGHTLPANSSEAIPFVAGGSRDMRDGNMDMSETGRGVDTSYMGAGAGMGVPMPSYDQTQAIARRGSGPANVNQSSSLLRSMTDPHHMQPHHNDHLDNSPLSPMPSIREPASISTAAATAPRNARREAAEAEAEAEAVAELEREGGRPQGALGYGLNRDFGTVKTISTISTMSFGRNDSFRELDSPIPRNNTGERRRSSGIFPM
jgi:hypothetical protein